MEKILIRGVNWIGDAVMTLPAIRSIRKAYRSEQLSLLVNSLVLPLFRNDPNIDELIEYKKLFKSISGKIKLARDLRKKNFLTAILLQNAFDAALISFLSGIRERVGYSRDARGFLLTRPIPINEKVLSLHHIRYYLYMLENAAIKPVDCLPWIYLNIDERVRSREQFSGLRRPVIGINPGATYGPAKRWPSEKFAGLIKRIIDDCDGSVVIFGSKEEDGIALDIVNRLTPDYVRENYCLNLSGRPTLRDLCSLISECDLFLTNDSGPMHIGYAVGTPVIAIFGSTSHELTGPPDFNHESEFGFGKFIHNKDIECSPCFERTCKFGHLRCLNDITIDEVYHSIEELTGKNRAIFFDRDGTICKEANYLNRMEDLEVFPEVSGLKRFKEIGFKLIGLTNQSGIERGIVDNEFVKRVSNIFIERYDFDDFYYCPHHPDDYCACRKPEPGMLYKARAEHGIDMKSSYIVGDKDSDILTAMAVGAEPVFLENANYGLTIKGVKKIKDLNELYDIIWKRT